MLRCHKGLMHPSLCPYSDERCSASSVEATRGCGKLTDALPFWCCHDMVSCNMLLLVQV